MNRTLRNSALLFALAGGAAISFVGFSHAQKTAKPQTPATVRFTDIRKAAGITFMQDSTETPTKSTTSKPWAPASAGLTTTRMASWTSTSSRPAPPTPTSLAHPLRSALYHNNGDGTLSPTSPPKPASAGEGHYGQGVAVGDYDNDGYPDLYVTGYGRAILYHNNGDGTFTDVTAKAGVADEGNWSTSAGWFDYDKDGWLDLVVTNYLDWSPKRQPLVRRAHPRLSFLLQPQ